MGPAYDEVLKEVAARVAATGSLGKLDLGALTAWKRLRADTPWMARLMGMPDGDVRAHTGRAVTAARDELKPDRGCVPSSGPTCVSSMR